MTESLPAVIAEPSVPAAPAGTALTVVRDAGTAVSAPAEESAESPPALEAKPARDPNHLTPLEAKRLILRVRRVRFYLSVRLPTYSDDEPGCYRPACRLVPVSAAQLIGLCDELLESERMRDRLVYCRLIESGSALFFGD